MTILRASIFDTPSDPFMVGASALRTETDGAVVVRDGLIVARGPYAELRPDYADEELLDFSGSILLPGFVDTHVHYPQIRAIGGLGMPLLEWLERCALREEVRLAQRSYAATVAAEFLQNLIAAGTTSALVFGAHFPAAMQTFFEQAEATGLTITAGLVLSDRLLDERLLVTPTQALVESTALIDRWHNQGSIRYAVTPRFSFSTSDEMLAVCAELMRHDGVHFTTHINENLVEVANVAGLFPGSRHYLDTYDQHGLVGSRSVFAHNVHGSDHELEVMAAQGAWTSHCPTSNSSLGSGLFPLQRHLRFGVGVALGSDVGAGTGMFVPKEALQAYFMQQLLGDHGYALTPTHLLYLCTRAGAAALHLDASTGDLSVGKRFDAVLLQPAPGSALAINLANAADDADALARVFALAGVADVAMVYSAGRVVKDSAQAGWN